MDAADSGRETIDARLPRPNPRFFRLPERLIFYCTLGLSLRQDAEVLTAKYDLYEVCFRELISITDAISPSLRSEDTVRTIFHFELILVVLT